MTEPQRRGLQPGHWVPIGIVVLVVVGLGMVVANRGDDKDETQPPVTVTTASSPAGPACKPTVAESGFTNGNGTVAFGLIASSACAQAAVNSVVTVSAVGKDGQELATGLAQTQISLPVLLPGQQAGLGGALAVEAPVSSLKIEITQTQNIAASEFASWPKTVRIADITHAAPDRSGRTQVNGIVVTDPSSTTLCNPKFYLILRDKTNKIIFGTSTTKSQPSFDERLPAGVDWAKAQISMVLGQPALGIPSGATLSCRNH